TLQNANIRFDLLSDRDISQGAVKLKDYKVILVPLLVDLPPEGVFSLTEYLKGGGKVVITDGGGNLGQNAQALARLSGVIVNQHLTTADSRQLVWKRDPLPLVQDFAVGTQYADVATTDGGNAVAKWVNPDG